MLTLRLATIDDAGVLFELRNDPLTRANFKNTDEVPWDVHIDWLAKSLKNPARLIFIGIQGQAVGTSRLDLLDSEAELSYTIAPAHRQMGYGYSLVRETLKHSNSPVKARVRPHNHASRRILETAGFRMVGEKDGMLIYCSVTS